MKHLTIATQITNREESPALQKYLDEIAGYPLLSIEEEVELFDKLDLLNPDNKKLPDQLNEFDEKTQGNIKKVVEKISRANLRFVVSVAKQYQQKNIELLDLINEGSIGLVKAIYRFDYTKGFKFISYAVWWIRQSILQHLQENKLIRYPANRGVYVNRINKFIRHFEQIYLRLPEAEEVCEGCNITQEDYERYLAVTCSKKISIDSKINPDEDDSKTIGETATMSQYSGISSPDSRVTEQTEINRVLELRLHSGSEVQYKYAFVCVLKFGLNPGGINPDGIGIECTDEEIVEKFLENGLFIKTESVRTLFDRAKKKLATILTPDGEIREEYKVYIERLNTNNPISDIFLKYSKEKITHAVEQLSKKPQTRSQAQVFSLRFGISNDRNPEGERYDIKKIVEKLERSEGSVKTTLDSAIKKLNDILSQLEIIPEPGNSIPDSNVPELGSNVPESGSNVPDRDVPDKVYTEPRDASEVDYWKCKIEEALMILENKIKKKIGLRVFRLYYGMNPDGKAYDGHTIAETLVKKPYTTTMHIRKSIEEKILNTIEGIDSSKLNKILENLKQSYRTTIIVDKTRDVSDVKYRRSQIEKALNLLKQEQESERKKGNQKRDGCEVFNLYYNSVDSDGEVYTAKKIAEKLGIHGDSNVIRILKNTTKEIRYKLGIDSFKMNQILKNLKKSNITTVFVDKPKDSSNVINQEDIEEALKELKQEQENERRGNRKWDGCEIFRLYYGMNSDGNVYTLKKIAEQQGISSDIHTYQILKNIREEIARQLGIDLFTMNEILNKLRDSKRKTIKESLEGLPNNTQESNILTNKTDNANLKQSKKDNPNSEISTGPRDSSDLNYRKEKVKQALKIFNNQKTKKEEDQYIAISLYSGLNKDGIAYSGKSFADKLERSYYQSAFTTLQSAEKKVAKILGIDLSKMKEILENLNASNRSAINDVLSNTPEETITTQIDTSDVDYRREQIIEVLPKLKEKRLLGSKKGIDKIKYDKGEVLRLHSGINPDGSIGKAYNNKEISESLGITYTYTPKVLTAAKRDVADILGIKLDDLEKILKNLRNSYSKTIGDVLEKSENNT